MRKLMRRHRGVRIPAANNVIFRSVLIGHAQNKAILRAEREALFRELCVSHRLWVEDIANYFRHIISPPLVHRSKGT